MGLYASTAIVTRAAPGLRRTLTAGPSGRGAAVHAGARIPDRAAFGLGSTGMREWVARPGGGTP